MGRVRASYGALAVAVGAVACGLDVLGAAAEQDAGPLADASPSVGASDQGEAPVATGGDARDAGLVMRADDGDASILVRPDADADATAACNEPGGKVFRGHCYFTLTARTQAQAKTDCAAVAAHLVTVNSLAEHDFLAGVGTGDRWIGLQAPSPSNDRAHYKWVTNEPSTVAYWYPNDPDGMGPCVAFRSALQSLESWVDRGCGDSNVAICERE